MSTPVAHPIPAVPLNPIWEKLNIPHEVLRDAAPLFSTLLNHCIVKKLDAMDFASDIVSLKSEATNRMFSYVANGETLIPHLDEINRDIKDLRETIVSEYVERGNETMPLQLEAIHCTMIRMCFMTLYPQIPRYFPVPLKVFLYGTH